MQKEFYEFGEVTFETKQRLNEILKDENKRVEYRKYYQNSEGSQTLRGVITSFYWKNLHSLPLINPNILCNMNFTNENIIWIIRIVVVPQILKQVYHGHYLWEMRKKKLKFDRELKQLKSALLYLPSKTPYSCKTNRLMLYIGFS